jgi:polysaccharide biosynthesis/export protein
VRVEAMRQPAANGVAAHQVPPLNSLAGLGSDYNIGANDLLDIEVFGVPDLKRTVRVNSSGLVSLALVGQVALAGLTAQQAEERLVAAYGEKYLQSPQVSVFIREFTTQRVTVEGAVARPGIYPITGQITLLRAIALAGGGVQFAKMDEVMVFRGSGSGGGKVQSLVYDLDTIRDGAQPDPVVFPEDVIVVKRDPRRTALRDSLFRDVIDSINPFSGLTSK